MRTTYVPKDTQGSVPKAGEKVVYKKPEVIKEPPRVQQQELREEKKYIPKYVQLYNDMREEAELLNSVGDAMDKVTGGVPIEDEKKPKKKKSKAWLIILIVLLVIGGSAGYVILKSNKAKSISSKRESVAEEISRLYTDDTKSNTKSEVSQEYLKDIYTAVSELKAEGEDVSAYETELNTISMFIEDKSKIDELSSPSYDLKTESLQSDLESISANTGNYSVPGLALTMSNLVASVQGEYDNYNSLLQELQGVTDYLNLDTDKYETDIQGITHEPNKQELSELYAGILQKHIEETANDKLEKKAKKKKDKAKDEALSKAEEAKEEAEDAKEQAEEKLKELLNSSDTGTESSEQSVESSTEVAE